MAGTLTTSRSSGSSGSNDLECPVCHEELSIPKILPCAHLACRRCVLSLMGLGKTNNELEDAPGAICPLCKVPVMPGGGGGGGGGSGEAQSFMSEEEMGSAVDALPTDLAAMTLLESHKVLQSQHICKVCESNVTATSFCLQCDAKLCRTCARGHTKLPTLKHHVLEELSQLTAQRLAASLLARCKTHDDRPAEVFCSAHYELICMLCATTNHRGCSEVKVIGEIAKQKRAELKREVTALRDKEKAMSAQVKEVKDMFILLRKRVKDTFDDLQQCVKKRRLEMNALIQTEEDALAASITQVEKTRSAMRCNASSMEQLADTAPDVAFLDMLGKLTARVSELDQRSGGASEKVSGGPVVDVAFEVPKLNHLKSVVSAIGRVTTKNRTRHSHSAKSTTSS